MRVRVVVAVLMVMMLVVMALLAAAHVMMVRLLRHAGIVLVADDLGAVFAQLAVHRRIAFCELADSLGKSVDDLWMVAQILGLDELDLRIARRDLVGLG